MGAKGSKCLELGAASSHQQPQGAVPSQTWASLSSSEDLGWLVSLAES